MEIEIFLEVEKENGELYEPPCSIQFECHPFVRATYWQPEEGGLEVECIIIAGVRCYDSADLRRNNVETYGADFGKIIDAHLQDIDDFMDPDAGRY